MIISAFGLLSTSCVKESNLDLKVDTITIAKIYRPDGLNGKDAIIESISPEQNFANSTHFTVFSWTNGGFFNTARALIEFDLSDIPPQTKITSAKLSLYWISYENLTEHTGDNAFSVYRVTEAWDEDSVTWNNQPSTSMANIVDVPKSSLSNQSYTDIDVTDLVQDIIDYPGESFGFMLKLNVEFPYKLVILASSDYSVQSKRPKLEIVE